MLTGGVCVECKGWRLSDRVWLARCLRLCRGSTRTGLMSVPMASHAYPNTAAAWTRLNLGRGRRVELRLAC